MPFKRFDRYDLLYNQVEAFPENKFLIYDSKVYFNNSKNSKDKFSNLHAVPQGYISLYELNVDRPIGTGGANPPPAGTSIYPFITKAGSRIAFKTVSTSLFDTTSQFAYGDIIKGSYPLSASIKRIRFVENSQPVVTVTDHGRFQGNFKKLSSNKNFINALKNTFNYYTRLSHHYAFDDSTNPAINNADDLGNHGWDKLKQEISLIEIPSIFYGSSIDKGSVSLKFYVTGTLAAELKDIKRNGELIQVSGTYDAGKHNNKVAGVVLYNEGFIALTGSWDINRNHTEKYVGTDFSNPKWKNFGVGANDGTSTATVTGSAFAIDFKGKNYIPTITMFAHMKKEMCNNSTNPTAYVSGSSKEPIVTKKGYVEFQNVKFKKLEHSDYPDPTGSFKKQTYVSKVGIYDDQRRLIGLAKLANPIRKTEQREYTFKLKLDF